jgi:prepilin-type N-terminal cleavage/methylation domain-containing protein
MKKDNRGLSLIELLVAFALLSIVSLIMISFITSSSNMYQKVSTDVSLQLQSQVTMAQIKEFVVDANGTIQLLENGFIVHNSEGNYEFTQVNDTVLYNGELLASHVQSLTASVDRADDLTIKSVTVGITFERNGETYSVEQVIALRNISVTQST